MQVREAYPELGPFPSDWEVSTLGNLGRLNMGKGLLKGEIQPYGEIPAIPYTSLYTDFSEVIDLKKSRWYIQRESAAYVVSTPCVLMASSSNVAANTGKACALVEYSPVAIGREVIVLKTQQCVAYISYLLSQARYRQRTLELAKGTTIKHVYPSTFSNYAIALPPEVEQRAIATALSDVDALIAGLERLIAKKRDIKQAAMQQLLTGQTRLPGFSGEWSLRRLGELAEMGSGGTPPSGNPDYYGGAIPWVAISDMTQEGRFIERTERNLSDSGLANSAAQLFPAGTVLYAIYASLGECSIACMELCTSQAILGIRPRAGLVRDFLYYTLTSRREFVKTLGQQGTQSNLNKGIVQGFEIHLPQPEEQTAIAATLSDMDADLVALESRLAKTRAIKQGMMQELLTGRTRLV